jgi:hypothetical protein
VPGGLDAHLLCELPAKRSAVEGTVTLWAVLLWTMARWNGPLARGIDGSVATLMAPADYPKMVTLPGSPPKAPMFSCTHSSAAIWSRRPGLVTPSPR